MDHARARPLAEPIRPYETVTKHYGYVDFSPSLGRLLVGSS
jgi:hypothetical protein